MASASLMMTTSSAIAEDGATHYVSWNLGRCCTAERNKSHLKRFATDELLKITQGHPKLKRLFCVNLLKW